MKTRVLFVCTGNSARSQMAEGLLRDIAGDRFEALSAGTEPQRLNPLAVEAMREVGIDISGQCSKDVRELLGATIPYVITVCSDARERCPVFPGVSRSMHWDVEDPAAAQGTHEEKLAVFRRIRDELDARIKREFGRAKHTRS